MKALAYSVLIAIAVMLVVIVWVVSAKACHTVELLNDEYCQRAQERGVVYPSIDSSLASMRATLDEPTLGKLIVLLALMQRQLYGDGLAVNCIEGCQGEGRSIITDEHGDCDHVILNSHDPCLAVKNTGKLSGTMNYMDQLMVTDGYTDNPCLDKMEAAMRAMEPYLNHGIAIQSDDPEYARKIARQSPVFVQWLTAKRECWRQP